jgi:23S rRNA (guanosine2251-2'-O)-methyltransferase
LILNYIDKKHQDKGKKQSQFYWLYGRNPVLQAILNPKRIVKELIINHNVEKLWRQQNINFDGYRYKVLTNEQIALTLPDKGINSQGVAALVKPLTWPGLEQFLAQLKNNEAATVIVLDQLTDPQNIGAIFRLALAFSADAIIMQDRHSPAENASIAKAAAGALELVPRIDVTNISSALTTLKEMGFWVFAMDGDGENTPEDTLKFTKKCFVFGSEGDGIRPLVKKNCDMTLRIPTTSLVESLNVATACAITLYSVYNR